MQLIGKIIAGTSTTITTKQGAKLDKTRLKILDVGDETSGDVNVYWADFMGDAALMAKQLDKVNHQDATIEIRRISARCGSLRGIALPWSAMWVCAKWLVICQPTPS
jgi:hypothetical protein